jgi:hypothetical protein
MARRVAPGDARAGLSTIYYLLSTIYCLTLISNLSIDTHRHIRKPTIRVTVGGTRARY